MKTLFLRLAAAMLASCLCSMLLVGWIMGPLSNTVPDAIREILLGAGLKGYQEALVEVPPEDRPAVVSAWGDRVRFTTHFEPMVELDSSEPWVVTKRSAGAFVHLPLDSQVAVVGPLPLPWPSWGRGLGVVLGVSAIVLLSTSLIVAPFARRLATLERALRRVRSGELSTRVDETGHDALSGMAVGFNHMAEALERRVRRQDELLQAVSHEYGTPLARLMLHTEMLARRLEGQHGDRIGAMRRDLGALEELTGELVSLVEFDAPVNGDALIADPVAVVQEAVRDEAGDMHVSVRVEGDASAGVPGIELDLRRCVANVVRNAVRYACARVTVTVTCGSEAFRVDVDDDGPGIPPEAFERVFEPFARLEPSRDRRAGGVGLGLAIARRCAERLGGTLTSARSPLGGARLTLWIGLAPEGGPSS